MTDNCINFAIYPFDLGSQKEKANKLAEETCEAYSAWEYYTSDDPEHIEHLCDECVDVIQAATNLMIACGATQDDISRSITYVTKHNIDRGRYNA